MQRHRNRPRAQREFLKVVNATPVQHIQRSQQVLVVVLSGFQQVKLHPGKKEGISNPHDRGQHMDKAEYHRHPSHKIRVHLGGLQACHVPAEPGSAESQVCGLGTDGADGMKTQRIPAALAASMPIGLSSKTRQSFGSTPRRWAATRNGSGAGFPCS